MQRAAFQPGFDGARFGGAAEMQVPRERETDFVGAFLDVDGLGFVLFRVGGLADQQEDEGGDDAEADGPDEVDEDRDHAGEHQQDHVRSAGAEEPRPERKFGHVPADRQQDAGQRGQRDKFHQRGQDEQDGQHRRGVDEARDRALRAGAGVGAGTGDHAGDRQAHEAGRGDVGDALGGQLGVGVMTVAGHAVGDDGAEQGFDADQQGDAEGQRQHVPGLGEPGGTIGQAVAPVRQAEARADLLELRADRRDGRIGDAEQGHDDRPDEDRDQGARNLERDLAQSDDHGEGPDRDREGAERGKAEVMDDIGETSDEGGDGRRGVGDAESGVELGAADDERDAGREADDHRVRDEADILAEAQGAEGEEHHACHQRREGEAEVAVGDDRGGADADEGAGRAGDLHAGAAEQGDDDAADDGRVEPLFRADPGGDRQAHREGEGDHADEQAGREVGQEVGTPIARFQ